MNQTIRSIQQDIVSSQQKMVEQLHIWSAINSGSQNLPGLAQMHQALASAFKPIACEVHSIPSPPIHLLNMHGDTVLQACGEGLFIRKRPHLKRRILLMGHMDTVYSEEHPFQTLQYLNDQHLNGPGVADMKGGLLVMLNALKAFESCSSSHTVGWDVFINADEEIGSIASSDHLNRIANQYQAALVYEPATSPEGMLAKNRKGSGKLTLIATGISAHAGRAFSEGRNAICYLAEAIVAINKLNGKKSGVTINVGKIAGGDALNIVPDKAVTKLDIRITKPEDEQWVRQKIEAIIHQLKRPGYTLTLHGLFTRPVKRINPPTRRLFKRIQEIGKSLGLQLDWEDSGGCCDGNNLSAHGLPVLDTLGVRGGHIHSSNEFIIINSLTERTLLSTLLLLNLAEGGLEELNPL